jgi:UDP-N-acetyl-D-mannosaminuronic acid dehydrogenase
MRFEKVCVLGLGYIGLPTASMFAKHGLKVVGVDVNQAIVDLLSNGKPHISEHGLDELVHDVIASGQLSVQTMPECADAFVIAVPTPFLSDKSADMRMVASAAAALVPHLRRGNLVILESTSPPLTTINLVKPILEGSGLRAGSDFYLAYSPERVLPGQILKELVENARVIGGVNTASAEAGRDLYGAFVRGEITCTHATTAEMVKLMENTFRDVNIALANEFALVAERLGVDVWEAIDLASRHPRVKILKPGPGVGGHCIAVDPWFLVEAAQDVTPLIRTAREVNDRMPEHVANMVDRSVPADAPGRIAAVLGVAYKANVDDSRESPALAVVNALRAKGFEVRITDPLVGPAHALHEFGIPLQNLDDAVRGADCVIVVTDHTVYRELDPAALRDMRHRIAIDCRACLDRDTWANAGYKLTVLGAPAGK